MSVTFKSVLYFLNMPRGLSLNEAEKGQIIVLHDSGKSLNFIAKYLRRSRELIQRFIKNPDEYGKKNRPGRPKKLSQRDVRRIINAASNSTKSCNDIRKECGLNVSKSTILRTVKTSKIIVRAKMAKAPRLTDRHKSLRLHFARKNMKTEWKQVSKI